MAGNTAPEPQILRDDIPEGTTSVSISPAFGGRFTVDFFCAGPSHRVPGTFSYVRVNGDGTIECGSE